ncbi:MAG: GntR family transcriptional regulator [Atopobiaceae bacterium]|nr:GntR family transcriptional regulator [Atopobiaceae bacterium]
MPNVDYKSPIYLQLREVVRSKIEEGEYLPGMAIPSENELSEMYGVNRLTVRNAVDALVNEGLLRRIQGKGAFVVGDRLERDLDSLSGFRQTIHERNAEPGTKVLAKTRRKAGGKYARIFGIGEDDDIFYVRRLNTANGEPISVEHTFIPAAKVPKLDGIDLGVFSLYEVYGFYGVSPVRAYETLDLVTLEARDARMLGVDPGQVVLLFTCYTYDKDDDVIEYTCGYTRGDKCSFTVHNRA